MILPAKLRFRLAGLPKLPPTVFPIMALLLILISIPAGVYLLKREQDVGSEAAVVTPGQPPIESPLSRCVTSGPEAGSCSMSGDGPQCVLIGAPCSSADEECPENGCSRRVCSGDTCTTSFSGMGDECQSNEDCTTGCTSDSDCAELTDGCSKGVCDPSSGVCSSQPTFSCGDGTCDELCGESATSCQADCAPQCDDLTFKDLNGGRFIVGDPFEVTCIGSSPMGAGAIERVQFKVVQSCNGTSSYCSSQGQCPDGSSCSNFVVEISGAGRITRDGNSYSSTVCYDLNNEYCTNDFSPYVLDRSGAYDVYSSVCTVNYCTPFSGP